MKEREEYSGLENNVVDVHEAEYDRLNKGCRLEISSENGVPNYTEGE